MSDKVSLDKEKIWSEAINSLGNKFDALKSELDKFPLAYSLQYSLEKGYIIVINEDYLFEENPIEWSKDLYASKPHVKVRD